MRIRNEFWHLRWWASAIQKILMEFFTFWNLWLLKYYYIFIFCSLSSRLANESNFRYKSLHRFSVGFRKRQNLHCPSLFFFWSNLCRTIKCTLCTHDSCWLLKQSVLLGKRISWTTLAKLGGKLVVSSLGPWEYIALGSLTVAELMPLRIFLVHSPGLL